MISYIYKVEDLSIEESKYTEWLINVVHQENASVGALTYVLVNDEELLEMNNKYLEHDYFTDVITFDYSEGEIISGDIFISWDRIKENARDYGVDQNEELRRVMVHGVLHLLGYDDKSEQEQQEMREKEDYNLNMFHVEH